MQGASVSAQGRWRPLTGKRGHTGSCRVRRGLVRIPAGGAYVATVLVGMYAPLVGRAQGRKTCLRPTPRLRV
jgi:hypothetical protein